MQKCSRCGARLRRVHRTFLERFGYLAIYECKQCGMEEFYPRRYRLHFGPAARCPKCGTYRIVRLKAPDKIDSRYHGILNLFERMAGGHLYHCRFCRIQFYDRRKLAADEAKPNAAAPAGAETPQDARSDA
jgi:DNA-directed RNA polymerase subunit RPC12/RpoP